jgi:hypothetical protein
MPSSDSLSGLLKWLGREEWRGAFAEILHQHLGPACEAAGIEFDEIAAILGDHHFMMLWACAFEDFLTRDSEPGGRNIVDDYLKRRGWKEPVANRRYMAALRTSTMSLYEVSEIVVGQSFLVRDLLRGGEPLRISERTATKSLTTWDRIGARVIELNGKTMIAGGVLPFTHEASEEVIRLLARTKKKMRLEMKKFIKKLDAPAAINFDNGALDEIVFAGLAPLITNVWLDDGLSKTLNPNLPTIVNNDGDEIVFYTARYPLASGISTEGVRSRLRSVPVLREASETVWSWVEAELLMPSNQHGAPPAAKAKAVAGQSYGVRLDDGATVFGTIELTDDAVVLRTNSSARAQRGQSLLTSALGRLVRSPLTKIETVEQAISSNQSHTVGPSDEIPPELRTELVRVTLDKHYRETLDQPVGMLGDITPRVAAKTKKGREKLVAWLKFLENHSARDRDRDDPMRLYDFSWMWTELGIANLRR